MSKALRPLSPHLQVYRPQLTTVLSILHRVTGIILSFGLLALSGWLIATSFGQNSFSIAQSVISSNLGISFLFVWSLALFYHLASGIRHLFWDIGVGFKISTIYVSGWITIIAAFLLTLVSWGIGFWMWGTK